MSKSAIANAVAAGGAEYAPVEMRSAQDKMDRATRAMDRGLRQRPPAGRAGAGRCAARRKMAESGKARKSAAVMQDDIRVLREEIERKSK